MSETEFDRIVRILNDHIPDGPYTVTDYSLQKPFRSVVQWRCAVCNYRQNGIEYDRRSFNRHLAEKILSHNHDDDPLVTKTGKILSAEQLKLLANVQKLTEIAAIAKEDESKGSGQPG